MELKLSKDYPTSPKRVGAVRGYKVEKHYELTRDEWTEVPDEDAALILKQNPGKVIGKGTMQAAKGKPGTFASDAKKYIPAAQRLTDVDLTVKTNDGLRLIVAELGITAPRDASKSDLIELIKFRRVEILEHREGVPAGTPNDLTKFLPAVERMTVLDFTTHTNGELRVFLSELGLTPPKDASKEKLIELLDDRCNEIVNAE